MFKPSDVVKSIREVGPVLDAIEALGPLIGKVADYVAGHDIELPPELPQELRSDIELRRLRVLASKAP